MVEKRPKCEATTYPSFWWNPDTIEFKPCSRNATVEIDGVKLCMQHAGTIAVVKLIHQKQAKRLNNDPNSPACPLSKEKRWSKKIKLRK